MYEYIHLQSAQECRHQFQAVALGAGLRPWRNSLTFEACGNLRPLLKELSLET